MGCDINHPLWSAKLLLENPRAIVDASRAYLDAGARIIATASYQASRDGLAAEGLSADEADEVLQRSFELAIQARDEFLTETPGIDYVPLIAASIGPWGATRHDGSEYTGKYETTKEELAAFHRQRLEVLDGSEADLIACETIPNIEEAHVLSEALNRISHPAWVSFCCRDDSRLSDGTPVSEAARLFSDHPKVFAVGANCTPPQYITALIRRLGEAAPGKDIVVYPNSGETFRVSDGSWEGAAARVGLEELVAEWIRAGATLVGGCCRVGPDQIRAIAETEAFAR
jgi:homocysteine S-methyltransferase